MHLVSTVVGFLVGGRRRWGWWWFLMSLVSTTTTTTTALLVPSTRNPKRLSSSPSRGGILVELGSKRKQKIKRWGNVEEGDGEDRSTTGRSDGGGTSAGFGRRTHVTNHPPRTNPQPTAATAIHLHQENKEENKTPGVSQSSSPPSSTKIFHVCLTAAEYARLNTVATQQQHELEESQRFMTEYLEQQLMTTTTTAAAPSKRQLVQISSNPLLFVMDNFVDPHLCQKVDNQANGCFQLLFPETIAEQLFQGQASEMDGLLFDTTSSQDHATTTSKEAAKQHSHNPHYPYGLHMDTNNQCLFRHVTCILYLNDVPEECGGATVFPVARALSNKDPALQAAQRLLDHSMSHTQSREIITLGLEEEARLLESRIRTNCVTDPTTGTAIRVQPKAGRLLVFFSRDEQGRPDPRTWHAGERLRPDPSDGSVTEKRILTLFKEVDYAEPSLLLDDERVVSRQRQEQECTLEAYLAPQIAAQRKWLQAKARLQKALLRRIGEDLEG